MSHDHCGEGSCSSHHHHDGCCEGHHHHHEQACCCHSHHHSCEEEACASDIYIKLADQAWLNVLRKKMEENLEKHVGNHLGKVAEFVCEANKKRWKGKFAKNHCIEEYKEGLKRLFQEDICNKDKK